MGFSLCKSRPTACAISYSTNYWSDPCIIGVYCILFKKRMKNENEKFIPNQSESTSIPVFHSELTTGYIRHFGFIYTASRGCTIPRCTVESTNTIHDKIVKKISDIKSCIEVFPLAKCLVESSPTSELLTNAVPQDHGVVSIYESVYYIHIQKWLSVVPRERFLFLTLEELSTNLERTTNDIWIFLGVNYLDNIKVMKYFVDTNKQTIIDYQHDPDLAMRNDTKELLRDFLHPYNRMLAELLGDRKFLWGD